MMLDPEVSNLFTWSVKGLLGLILTIIGWLVRENKKEVETLHCEIEKVKDDVVRNYVSKNDWRESVSEQRRELERINDKLDKIFIFLTERNRIP